MNRTLRRALWSRPFVLAAAGLGAGLVNPRFRPGPIDEIVIASVAVPALLAAWAAERPSLTRGANVVSIGIGLIGWTIFSFVTNGVYGPLVVGFLLEILIAAISMGVRGVTAVTVGSSLALVGMAWTRGADAIGILSFELVLVAAAGALGAAMVRRRQTSELALRTQGEELGQRLDSLQRELEDERVISRVGENVARLAHGLKNAVHSLRGFVTLIEPELDRGASGQAALAGLHAAIDDLEKLARLTLADGDAGGTVGPTPESARSGAAGASSLGELLAAARGEIETANPGVEWTVDLSDGAEAARVGVERETLLEMFVILMRNAVEAMDGRGRGRVELSRLGRFVRIAVADEGPGFPAEMLGGELQPGVTTKEKGSGFGLFLARRIAGDAGGHLEIGNLETGGAFVQVALPSVEEGFDEAGAEV
ncbi:MAG: HAMP domain-containing histidine kinase [bacterium]|nr:HAMP domain-containing histidine kinase [bacterium]